MEQLSPPKIRNKLDSGDEYLDAWWNQALDKWSHALQFTYHILIDSPGQKQRALGEWFLNEGVWCIQLEGSNVAQIDAQNCNESVRNALSWTLQTLHGAQKNSNGLTIDDVLLRLADAPVEKLREVFHHNGSFINIPTNMVRYPGYLLWIRFGDEINQPFYAGSREDNEIDSVLKEFVLDGWYIWFSYKYQRDSILLYQPISSLSDVMERTTEDLSGYEDKSADENRTITLYTKSLAAMLESDAMITPTLFVSQKSMGNQDIYHAIATLALVHQRHAQKPASSSRIAIFANEQLEYWLSLLPANMQSLFIKWTVREEKALSMTLQREMCEVLEGLIAANLNVSEASRALYLHRNTLVNRIERMKQLTGFDIRNFFDATTLWMILKMK